MDFMSTKQAAEKWSISHRRVLSLCSEGQIDSVQRGGNMWLIPNDTPKPVDGRSLCFSNNATVSLKPFVKWAGGKGQLLKDIRKMYPVELGKSITKYAEPFVGGGAVLFDILSTYTLTEIYISDINAELINTYLMIRDDVSGLVKLLSRMQDEYVPMGQEDRKAYYYKKRSQFNELKTKVSNVRNLESAALFIFLNRTCFNGLYRVNRKGLFNVPIGSYKKPVICDAENLRNVSKALKNVIIVCGDYKKSADFIDESTFVYFDPPYRPITETASFTSYTEDVFDDNSQRELASFMKRMVNRKAKVVVSNSDPKNSNTEDDFFEKLYAGHRIVRVEANRMINCNSEARGRISELLISNY